SPGEGVGPAAPTVVASTRAAVLVEARGHAREKVLVHNGLELVVSARTLSVDGETVNLTRSEFDLLAVLLAAPRRVISKDELARSLWSGSGLSGGEVVEADRRTIEVHVANLRRKIGENRLEARFIETVRGAGYRLTPTTTN
ncbi:winged helix-turn-helix domain-containing protein, partial [Georgenia sp.]